MSRMENREVMGFFAIDPKHHAAITSLVTPATPGHKLLDPYAGEGAFLEAAAQGWNVTPYANELDGERAAAWLNPPYDHSKVEKGNKRIEFVYLRHSWKWLQDGALALWCIYSQHITEDSDAFLARNSRRVDCLGAARQASG